MLSVVSDSQWGSWNLNALGKGGLVYTENILEVKFYGGEKYRVEDRKY